MEEVIDPARVSPARPLPPVLPGAAAPRLETRDGAYELKFLLREAQVAGILAWAREHLSADPHAAASEDETYWVHSVYLDTDDLAVYHRRRGFRQSKFRLRRYGSESTLYLEEKRKREGWVSKVRSAIPEAEVALLQALTLPDGWAGEWFRQALEERQLVPRCQVAYRRLAREGEAEGAPVRLTIDRDLRCAPVSDFCPSSHFEQGQPLPVTVLELKFRDNLPRLFKGLIRTFGLSSVASSKYRRAAEACGFALPE